jgi:hypothetical protein
MKIVDETNEAVSPSAGWRYIHYPAIGNKLAAGTQSVSVDYTRQN